MRVNQVTLNTGGLLTTETLENSVYILANMLSGFGPYWESGGKPFLFQDPICSGICGHCGR